VKPPNGWDNLLSSALLEVPDKEGKYLPFITAIPMKHHLRGTSMDTMKWERLIEIQDAWKLN